MTDLDPGGSNLPGKSEQSRKDRSVMRDLLVTLLQWAYFIFGFLIFFAPFYLIVLLLPPFRTRMFQWLNHYFYRGFFGLFRLLIPALGWHIDPKIKQLRSAVIICNHTSYIDSILMISLFKRHNTIVKERLFHIPIFGWMIRMFGYLPSTAGGALGNLLIRRTETLCAEMAKGTNVFVFPEGTRSRDGSIGTFHPGAFKIARLCRSPIDVTYIRNAEKLFQPGRFLFNTGSRAPITLTYLGRIDPDYDRPGFSISKLMENCRAMMEQERSTKRS